MSSKKPIEIVSSLVESCSNFEDAIEASKNIHRMLQDAVGKLISSESSITDESNQCCVELEDIPQILYQLTLICSKVENSTSSSQIEELSGFIKESIVENGDSLLVIYFNSELESFVNKNLTRIRLENIYLSLCHYLSISFVKDAHLSNQMLLDSKNRELYSPSRNYVTFITEKHNLTDTDSIISPTKLLLTFMIAKSNRQEDKVINLLHGIICEIYDLKQKIESSLWFQDRMWNAGNAIRDLRRSLKIAFEVLFASPFMIESSIRPILVLAFYLIDNIKPIQKSSWEHITSSVPQCVPSPLSSECLQGHAYFGAWILEQLFFLCKHSRIYVIRELISRFSLPFTYSENSNNLNSKISNKDFVSNICVGILKSLCSKSKQSIIEIQSELHEVFMYIPQFSPYTAGELVSALVPLFEKCPGMADKCSLSVRKACFSKDTSSRKAAVSTILALLRSHFSKSKLPNVSYQSMLNSSSSSSNERSSLGEGGGGVNNNSSQHNDSRSKFQQALNFQNLLKERVATGTSIEEVLVLLKRFLQHQSSVRSLLYENIYQLSIDFPEFLSYSLRLLRVHFLSLMQKDSDATRINQARVRVSESYEVFLDLEKCLDESNRPQENIKDLVSTLLSLVILDLTSEERNLDLFSQSASQSALTDSMTFTQSLCLQNSREPEFACEVLWNFTCFLSDMDLDVIATSSPANHRDFNKLEVLFTAYYASIICAITIPELKFNISEEKRKKVLISLLKKSKIIIIVANKYKKTKKEMISKNKKTKRNIDTEDSTVNALDVNTSDALLVSSPFNNFDTDSSNKYHLMLELRFISKLLLMITLNSLDSDEETDQENSEDLKNVEFLPELLLERSNICLEKVINILQHSVAEDASFISEILPIIKSLYPSLMRYLMLMRTKDCFIDAMDRKINPLIFLSNSVLNSISLTQLVLRALLGCIKIIVSSHSHKSNDNFETIIDLGEMLDINYLNNVINDGGVRTTNYDDTNRNFANSIDIISVQLNNFIDLLFIFQSSRIDSDKNDIHLIVLLIGELVGCLSRVGKHFSSHNVDDPRSTITEKIIKECAQKLRQPSSHLSQSLVQLLVIRCPVSAGDRLSKALLIGNLIADCISNKENQIKTLLDNLESQVDANEISDSIADETFSLLCTSNMSSTALALLSILDKALLEVNSLMKFVYVHDKPPNSNDNIPSSAKAPIYTVIKRLCEIINQLISSTLGDTSLEKVLVFISKLYKIQVQLVRDLITSKSTLLSHLFKQMLTETAEKLSPKIQNFLSQSSDWSLFLSTSTKKRKMSKSNKNSSNKLDKVIPVLIFQMEQLDVQLIKLSNILTLEKTFISKLIKRSQIRDFRLKVGDANRLTNQYEKENIIQNL